MTPRCVQNDSSSPAPLPSRLKSVDALRGLCALVVFVTHWHLWSSLPRAGAVEDGLRATLEAINHGVTVLTWPTGAHHPAVIAFFVLSGFCIHYPYAQRAANGAPPPSWREYFRRRFSRIMPVYWAASLIGLAFVAAETFRPTGHDLLQLHAASSWEDVLVRFAGLGGMYPKEIFVGNYILITITVEIVAYAVYPLVYRAAARGQWRLLGLIVLAMHVFAIALLPFVTPVWVYNSIFMLGLFWYAGALAAHLAANRQVRVHGLWLLLVWAAFLGLKLLPRFYGQSLLKQAAWGGVCMLGILWALKREIVTPALVERAPVRFLRHVAEFSYSLYAVHTPVIMLATWALLTLGRHNYLLQLATTMTLSLLATLVVYHAVERTFYPRRPAASPAVPPIRRESHLARS